MYADILIKETERAAHLGGSIETMPIFGYSMSPRG